MGNDVSSPPVHHNEEHQHNHDHGLEDHDEAQDEEIIDDCDDGEEEEVDASWRNMMNIVFDEDMDSRDANNLEDEHKERQQRGPRDLTYYTADDGSTKPMTPCMMLWFNMYITYPRVECEHFQKKF